MQETLDQRPETIRRHRSEISGNEQERQQTMFELIASEHRPSVGLRQVAYADGRLRVRLRGGW